MTDDQKSSSGGSELLRNRQRASDDLFIEYLDLLRKHGLLRTDCDRSIQGYSLRAAGAGFYFMEQFLPPDPQLLLERKAAALAEIIRRAFEPPTIPSPRHCAPSLPELSSSSS